MNSIGGSDCIRPVAACWPLEKQTLPKIALPPTSSRSLQPILGMTAPAGEKSLQRQREREGRASPDLTLDPDLAAVQRDELA